MLNDGLKKLHKALINNEIHSAHSEKRDNLSDYINGAD